MKSSYQFPEGFVWGVAAASAQIEGAAFEDGKGESIWDRFSRQPGAVFGGHNLDVACDHYHRYESDADLMQELGFRNYRLSLSWPRVMPEGRSSLGVNWKGVEFYDRLIDALLARGIIPWVTLFHWDLPQVLEDQGGWLSRSTPEAFIDYAMVMTMRLGDRVKNWFTLNEIPCFIGLGYGAGIHAPGRKENAKDLNQAYHHALLAHGFGVEAVRSNVPGGKVGLVHNPTTPIPVIETPGHIEEARLHHEKLNGQLLGPVFRGAYPDWWLEKVGGDAPEILPGDMEFIAQSGDFLGLNLYAGHFARGGSEASVPWPQQFPTADLDWIKVTPQTLYWQIRFCAENFGIETTYITENGAAFADKMDENGEVLDLDRRELMRNYLISLHRASDEGFDIRGYFGWSVMDNFEWAEGYDKRFGLIHVDYETQKRTPKLSAQWFSAVCRENRVL